MNFLRDASIRKKIIFIIMLTTVITLLVTAVAHMVYDGLQVRQVLRRELLSLADIVGSNSSAALLFNDEKAANSTLLTLRQHAHIYAAYIVRPDRTVLAHYVAAGTDKSRLRHLPATPATVISFSAEKLEELQKEAESAWDFDLDLEVVRKTKLDGEEIGLVVIQAYLLEPFLSRMKWFLLLIFLILAGALLLAFVISSHLQGLIANPILRLAELMKLISDKKNYSVRAVKENNDEVGILYDGFNAMLADIQKRDEKLAEYHQDLKEEITARTRASDEWRATFDATREIIILLDRDLNVIKANRASSDLLGKTFSEIIGKPVDLLLREAGLTREIALEPLLRQTLRHEEEEIFWPERKKWLAFSVDPVWNSEKKLTGSVLIIRDITNLQKAEEIQKDLQAQLLQIQKMDSMGRLAGGIAHDFNNILSSILGYSELALLKLDDADPIGQKLRIIKSSGEKAAALTRQLLLFSRKQVTEMKIVDPGPVIEEMTKMLARLIGENIKLEVSIHTPIGLISCDVSQVEQVLMNLVVNARDAMPGGGTLRIAAQQATLQEDPLLEIRAGDYVMITVTDSGEGMSRELQEKIFEPFFTTKAIGKGTGLGLATAYGIVQQHRGYIQVYSEPGKGSTFRIYFPVSSGAAELTPAAHSAADTRGTETILVAEDDEQLRAFLRLVLEERGYLIVEAADGEEAVQILRQKQYPVHLVLMDVIMPKKNGKEAYHEMAQIQPDIKTLFMSGYTADIISPFGILEEGIHLIHKPVSAAELLTRVREILDA